MDAEIEPTKDALVATAAMVFAMVLLFVSGQDPDMMLAAVILALYAQSYYLLFGLVSLAPSERKAFNWSSFLLPNSAVTALYVDWAAGPKGEHTLETLARVYEVNTAVAALVTASLTHLAGAGLWLAFYIWTVSRPGGQSAHEDPEEEPPPKKRIWVPGDDD